MRTVQESAAGGERPKSPLSCAPTVPATWVGHRSTDPLLHDAFGWNDRLRHWRPRWRGQFLKNFNPRHGTGKDCERAGQRLGSIFIANGGTGTAKLRMLYVEEAARGLGLGKLLVTEAIQFARQCGYRQVSLWTNDNLDAARAIYRSAGFRLVSEESHTLFGPELKGQTWVLDL